MPLPILIERKHYVCYRYTRDDRLALPRPLTSLISPPGVTETADLSHKATRLSHIQLYPIRGGMLLRIRIGVDNVSSSKRYPCLLKVLKRQQKTQRQLETSIRIDQKRCTGTKRCDQG